MRKEEYVRKIGNNTDEKLNKVQERKNTMEKEQVDKILKQMESKLESAEQLRTQAIETKVGRAKKVSEKLVKVKETRDVMEKEN